MKTLIATAAVLFIASTSQANHGEWGKKGLMCTQVGKEKVVEKLHEKQRGFMKNLKLSEDQKNKVKDIQMRRSAKLMNEIDELRAAHADLMAAIERDAPSAELREKLAVVQGKKTNLMTNMGEEKLEMREVLTADQRRKAIAKIKDEHEDMCD